MKKYILCLSALLLATTAYADDRRFYTTRDGAGYEAGLRNAGIPQSAGMVWPVANPAAVAAVSAPSVAQAPRPKKTVKSAGSAATRRASDA